MTLGEVASLLISEYGVYNALNLDGGGSTSMTAVAGTSFGDQAKALFGAEVGENLNRHVQAYADFTYFDNLITDSAQGYLTDLSSTLTRLTATPWNMNAT